MIENEEVSLDEFELHVREVLSRISDGHVYYSKEGRYDELYIYRKNSWWWPDTKLGYVVNEATYRWDPPNPVYYIHDIEFTVELDRVDPDNRIVISSK